MYKRAFAHIGLEPGARVQRLPSQVTGSRPRGTTPLTEREPFGLARLRRVGSRRGPRNGRADQEGRKGLGSSRLPYRDAGPAAFPPASRHAYVALRACPLRGDDTDLCPIEDRVEGTLDLLGLSDIARQPCDVAVRSDQNRPSLGKAIGLSYARAA